MKFPLIPIATLLALPLLAIALSSLLTTILDITSSLSKPLSASQLTTLLKCLGQSNVTPQESPYLTTDAWLQRLKYTVTNVSVTTDDGYILKVFRVTGSPNFPNNGSVKPAIYVNHGLGGSSNMFLIQEGPNNIITQLADNGYDVWIGNCRGNTYSNKHVNLTANNLTYWDFSWHELGIYDVPAVIDKIISVTKQSQIYYLGYSMGTTQIMVLLSERPEYNAKLKLVTLWAPAAIINDATTPLRAAILLTLNIDGKYLTDLILGGRINTHEALPKFLGSANIGSLCAASSVSNCGVCDILLFFLYGYNPQELNYTSIGSLYTNALDVYGTKCVVHYAQHFNDALGRFRKFDYGPVENQKRYKQADPPEYDLTKITAPTVAYYSKGDILCPKANVEKLFTKFAPGTLKQKNLVDPTNEKSAFNHMDFIGGKNDYAFVIQSTLKNLDNDRKGLSL